MKGLASWLRTHLFSSMANSLITLVILFAIWQILPSLVAWALTNAVWSPGNADLCRQTAGQGACWAFVAEKFRFILFGTYPFDEHWRPALAIVSLLLLYALTALRILAMPKVAGLWLGELVIAAVLLWGGIFGLGYVENERWGGLTLTLLLSTIGLAVAFPLAIFLALGRRSELPVIRWLCIAYIELIRGVPLISLLFMASVLLPLFLPDGVTIDKLLRAQIAMILFAAAYLAEVIRGGLQAVPRQQEEAAKALGHNYWQRMRLIILPQALRLSIPPLVNTFIGFFKDTSLVIIIGLFDFLSSIKAGLAEPEWSGFGVEAYVFAALGYFVFCYPMSRYSRKLERSVSPTRQPAAV